MSDAYPSGDTGGWVHNAARTFNQHQCSRCEHTVSVPHASAVTLLHYIDITKQLELCLLSCLFVGSILSHLNAEQESQS
jgi:hypothetical protein